MATLSSLKAYTVPFSAVFGEVVITGKVTPAQYTDRTQQQILANAQAITKKIEANEDISDEERQFFAGVVAGMIREWDLTDDDGKACPITGEFLAEEVGPFVISALFGAIQEAMNPNVRRGEGA